MPRNKIFVSYSHKDKDLCDEVLKFLDAIELEVWSDRDIKLGRKIDKTIEEAIDQSCAALLLLSVDFLNSSYIREKELPLLLRAEQNNSLRITWLALYACPVEKKRYSITTSSDRKQEICLVDFLGLNKPKEGLPNQKNERDKVLTGVSEKLYDWVPKTKKDPASDASVGSISHELIIRLKRKSSTLHRFYLRPDRSRITDRITDWKPADIGKPDGLLRTLFPKDQNEDYLETILQGMGAKTPLEPPLKLRLETDDPQLLSFAWQELSWQAQPLLPQWRVSFVGSSPLQPVDLPSNPEFLCIVSDPQHEIGAAGHTTALQNSHKNTWDITASVYKAASLEELERANQESGGQAPNMVYLYGKARLKRELEVLFATSTSAKWIALNELAGSLIQKTQILFLNLIGVDQEACACIPKVWWDTVPLLVVQTTQQFPTHGSNHAPDVTDPRYTALQWLQCLNRSVLDPVDQIPFLLRRGSVWWDHTTSLRRSQKHRLPVEKRLVRLLLDREIQRNQLQNALNHLTRDENPNVINLLAYATPGNHVELFGQQAEQFLLENVTHPLPLQRIEVPLTKERPLDSSNLSASLRAALPASKDGSLVGALKAAKLEIDKAKPAVLFLDWGATGGQHGKDLSEEDLKAWADFHCDVLAGRGPQSQCPNDVNILSLIAKECAEKEHSVLKDLIPSWAVQNQTQGFDWYDLDPLSDIRQVDIKRCIERFHCPRAIQIRFTELLWDKTGGMFEKCVRWIQAAVDVSWEEVMQQLEGSNTESDYRDDGA